MLYCRSMTRNIDFKIVTLVASSVMLASCATPLTREERIGPDDGSDVCRPNVVALDSTGNFFAEDMIKGAVAGAAAGGLYAILSGKSGRDAAAAVAAGVVVGAVGGYFKHRMEQGRDQAVLAIGNDLSREANELDKTDRAVHALIACRVKQRDRIRVDYASGRISRGEAQRRWSVLQEQVHRDNNLMQMVAENIGKRQDQYRDANEQIAAEFDISKLPPAQQREARRRIDANDRVIDQEYRREVATINQDIAKMRKTSSSGRKSATDLEQEKQRRQAAAQKARDTKKEVNRKTGGQQSAVQLASKFSSTQKKAENTVNTAKNYQSEVAVTDNGFEKSSLWDIPRPTYALHIVG